MAFAFAAVGMAATSYMRSWQDFDLVTLAILPMFLFSTTFYPISVYPRWLQIVVECLPLYHAVELMRGLTTGAVRLGMLGHLGYFAVMIAVGVAVAGRRLGACCSADHRVERPGGGLTESGGRQWRMSVTLPALRLDRLARGAAVAVLAVVQIVVAAMAGSGATGERVGGVPLVPHARCWRRAGRSRSGRRSTWASSVYAVYQLLPAQRGREMHRRTGWWLAASAVLNTVWIIAFSGR